MDKSEGGEDALRYCLGFARGRPGGRVGALFNRKEGQVLGSEVGFMDSPWDSHREICNRHKEEVVFSSAVKSELMTLI